MNALSSVPDITSNNISNTIGMSLIHRRLSLTHIFSFSQLVLRNRLLIFNSFLNNNCFRELPFKPFRMQRHCSPIKKSLFTISKPMLIWIYMPVIFSIFLFSWSKVSMSFIVHLSDLGVLFHGSSHWVKHIFGTFTSNSWHSEWVLSWIFHSTWPVIVSLVRVTERLLRLWSILLLLDVIEFICQTSQVLGFYNSINVVWSICFLSVCIVPWDIRGIVEEAWVDLFDPRLVLSALSVFSNVLWSPWDVS